MSRYDRKQAQPQREPLKGCRVAAYARVSTEQDEQQSSYEAQVDFYTHYIQSNPNWEFVSVFADEGITGTNTKKRDGFNLMIQKAMNGEIDLILTKSLSRFAPEYGGHTANCSQFEGRWCRGDL